MTPSLDLSLKFYPDPILRTKCIECTWSDEERTCIGEEMIKIMFVNNGYGLSANQVGLNQRLFVMQDPHYESKGLIFANPVITGHNEQKVKEWEGCLSLLSRRVMIERFTSVRIEYDSTDYPGQRTSWTYAGLRARCIQHEIDHLDSILIFDHIKGNLAQKMFLEKYSKEKEKHDRL